MINYRKLPTEQRNPLSESLDALSIEKIVELMNRENGEISRMIRKVEKDISEAIRLIVRQIRSGGRIFFIGAGTSGRLGVIESAEMPPTFSTPPSLVQAIMSGGKKAVFRSQEGAEDNRKEAKRIVKRKIRHGDVVIGIAASGVTPFVKSGLSESKRVGAKTILLTCNPQTAHVHADVLIAPRVGPEIIAGSTRLKSGTATKMILNMLTTVSMVHLGKVYGNRMVDLQPKSKKLRERGIALVEEMAHLSRKRAVKVLEQAQWSVKTAIVMAKKKCSCQSAVQMLKDHDGFLGRVLK